MYEETEQKKSRIITYIVFGFALVVVILNIISLIFPALFVTSFGNSESNFNSLELGAWTIPFFIINLSILVFGFLYYRKMVPDKISNSFEFILNFETSQKITIIVFSIMVGFYIIMTVGELSQLEIDVWQDWKILGPIIENFPSTEEGPKGMTVLFMKNFLLFSSQVVFHNVKVIPFIGSISLIFITYFLTVRISKKRFAGLVAIAVLLQSHTFLRYDTTATFSNFWTSLYLVSLYMIYKKWPLSPLTYIASIFSKAFTALFCLSKRVC